MKLHNIALLLATLVATFLLALAGQLHAALILFFVGSAAATPWARHQPHVFGANTIDSSLQLTEVLGSAMEALKRRLLVLKQLGAIYRDVALKGDDKMAVPFYPLTATGTSVTRTATGSRLALASSTATEARTIENWTNKVQAISFSATDRARQPMFDPVKHGQRKGEALAFDVIADIFSMVKAKTFTGTSIPNPTAANFDENDVGDLRTACVNDYWPEMGRSLILSPAYGTNLLKQAQIIDSAKRGDGGMAFRDVIIGQVLGFDIGETPGLPTNNGLPVTITGGVAATNVITAVAHGLTVGDRVIFPTLTGGAGLTPATVEYYVETVPSADTFTVSATLGGAQLDFTTAITDGTVRAYEDVLGIACLESALLIGFAPVPPTPAILSDLHDYQELVDDSGLVLQYYHKGYGDTDQELQSIECHYGFGLGDAAQLKIIRNSLT
jgi:hypothetical protein